MPLHTLPLVLPSNKRVSSGLRASSMSFVLSAKSVATARILLACSSLCLNSSSFLVAWFSLRWNMRVSTTIPFTPLGTRSEESLTSPDLLPKIARSNFSSGVSSDSPFGVTFPTKISPGLTSIPMRTMPSSSNKLRSFSLTLGTSLVISSLPRLVSLTSISYSSI